MVKRQTQWLEGLTWHPRWERLVGRFKACSLFQGNRLPGRARHIGRGWRCSADQRIERDFVQSLEVRAVAGWCARGREPDWGVDSALSSCRILGSATSNRQWDRLRCPDKNSPAPGGDRNETVLATSRSEWIVGDTRTFRMAVARSPRFRFPTLSVSIAFPSRCARTQAQMADARPTLLWT